MSLLSQVQAAVQKVQGNSDLNELRFRHTATWSDGTSCRFSVERLDPLKLAREPMTASLLKVRVHVLDTKPAPGSTALYEGYTLSLGQWSDPSDFTGQSFSVARVIDARVYPQAASVSTGTSVRLRIEAMNGSAVQAGSGAMDVAAVGTTSHRGRLPPGTRLNQGDALTTDQGERFRVMDPIQRDILGDTVGLSREGTGLW